MGGQGSDARLDCNGGQVEQATTGDHSGEGQESTTPPRPQWRPARGREDRPHHSIELAREHLRGGEDRVPGRPEGRGVGKIEIFDLVDG